MACEGLGTIFSPWAELNLCWFAHYAAITTKVMEPDGEQVADEI
jgi:hypothetical protein